MDGYVFWALVILTVMVFGQRTRIRALEAKASQNERMIQEMITALNALVRQSNDRTQKTRTYGATQRKPPRPESCWDTLGIKRGSNADQINWAWKILAKEAHPDRGGTHEAMTKLNEARAEALARAGMYS
jgi:hypothetical protein